MKLALAMPSSYHWITWNQKNLDYEIETLKPPDDTLIKTPWNQKNLDYEIETKPDLTGSRLDEELEIKRTSITRLKLANR